MDGTVDITKIIDLYDMTLIDPRGGLITLNHSNNHIHFFILIVGLEHKCKITGVIILCDQRIYGIVNML